MQHLKGDVNLAWPSGEVAVMGAKGAVEIIFRNQGPEVIAEEVKEYEDKFANPMAAGALGPHVPSSLSSSDGFCLSVACIVPLLHTWGHGGARVFWGQIGLFRRVFKYVREL